MDTHRDYIVIGAGIVSAFLAPHGKVTLLEREQAPGYFPDIFGQA